MDKKELLVISNIDNFLYPFMIAPIIVKDIPTIEAIQNYESDEIIIVPSKNESKDIKNLFKAGVVGNILRVVNLDDGSIKVLFQGSYKAIVSEFKKDKNFGIIAVCEPIVMESLSSKERLALHEIILEYLEDVVKQDQNIIPYELLKTIEETNDLDKCIDLVANICKIEKKELFELFINPSVKDRAIKLIDILKKRTEMLKYNKKLKKEVNAKLEKTNKDYFLRQQLKQIQAELGDIAQKDEEIEKYNKLLEKKKPYISSNAYKEIKKQIQKLARQGQDTSESAVLQTYIETVLEIPFEVCKEEPFSYEDLKQELAKNHYGLKEPKERIEEFFATKTILKERKVKDSIRTILCFVGPPGVGKTSLAISISKALKKTMHRVALGGLEDINELKGHRRTYVGAMPGRIVQGFIDAKTMNVLFVLDEIDKLSSSYKGDPASVFLELLDPEQNDSFRDHYLNFDIDLSNVVFIATANDISRIPAALKDRMEIITLSSYTQVEKYHIAKEHLIKSELEKHAIKDNELVFKDDAIELMIEEYTREAGVRKLKEQIAKICRKFNKQMLDGKKKLTINKRNLDEFLEKKVYEQNKCDKEPIVGQINGLAYTSVGGDLLKIQAIMFDGKGGFELTGMLGDVMKESAKIALNVAKNYITLNKLAKVAYDKKNIFLHAPDGATPKDGPSAGLAMVCVLTSCISGKKLRQDIAMTGEVDLLGNALPIGGLKEKLIAAYKAGVKEVFLPRKNEQDLKEVPEEVKKALKITLVDKVEEILKKVLINK